MNLRFRGSNGESTMAFQRWHVVPCVGGTPKIQLTFESQSTQRFAMENRHNVAGASPRGISSLMGPMSEPLASADSLLPFPNGPPPRFQPTQQYANEVAPYVSAAAPVASALPGSEPPVTNSMHNQRNEFLYLPLFPPPNSVIDTSSASLTVWTRLSQERVEHRQTLNTHNTHTGRVEHRLL